MKNLIKIKQFRKKIKWWFVSLGLFITILNGYSLALASNEATSRPPISLISDPFQPDLFTGKASSNISIKIPPGRCGMQPDLSLIYYSGSGNTWLGVGWDLCPGRIDKTKEDTYEFYFQGNRTELVSIGSNEYRTKTEAAFLKFYFDGTYWQVWDKNGTRFILGSISESRLENDFGTFQWFLDNEIDVNGNYITYSYDKDQGQVYLSHIAYTGNENMGNSPATTVNFILEDRDDAIALYNFGSEIKTAKRLHQIEIKIDGVLARKYILGYDYSIVTNGSLLALITEYGSDEVISYPPITFSYHTGTHQYSDSSTWITGYAIDGDMAFNGDFNGDKKDDIGMFFDAYNSPGWPQQQHSTVKIAFSNGRGSFDPAFEYSSRGLTFATYGSSAIWTRDFDGDEKTDLGLLFDTGGANEPIFSPFLSTGTGFFETYGRDVFWGGYRFIQGDRVFKGDFNGDGKTDVGGYYDNQNYLTVRLSNGHGLETEYLWADNIAWAGATKTSAGDFNGDGLDDLYAFFSDSGSWYVALSTGHSFNPPTLWKQNFGTNTGSSGKMIGDFNGDGLTDIGICYLGSYVSICFSGGFSFGQYVRMNKNIEAQNSQNFGIGDFNGDRIDDITIVDFDAGQWYVSLKKGSEFDLLKQIDNGIGGITIINYIPSFDLTNTDMGVSVQVVSSIIQNDGLGNSYTTTYDYSGGQFDSEDKEFRGFNYVKVTNPEGDATETWFHQDDIYKGKAYRIDVKDSQNNLYTKTMKTWENTNPHTDVNFPYLSSTENYIYDGDDTYKATRTNYGYDEYGNVTSVRQEGDISISGDEREIITEYTYNTSKWILSCPYHTYSLASDGATKVRESWYYYDNHENYRDEPVLGMLTKEENWLDTGPNPTIIKDYDDYGNLVSSIDAGSNETTTLYDEVYHTYPIKITNTLGHEVKFTYDPKTGEILTKEDANNNITTYEYDNLGRIIKIIGPDDNSEYPTIEYSYDLTTRPVRTVAYIRERSGENSIITVYNFYDGLGRQIQIRKDVENNTLQSVHDTVSFNSLGLVEYKWLPYFAQKRTTYAAPSADVPKITYQYDTLGRVTRVTNADETYRITNYSDWVTTEIDENNHRKVFHRDAYGNIIQVDEYNLSSVYQTAYRYDSMGSLLTITDDAGNISSMGYDSLGRKISMDDPDMGSWSYGYDANGNLIRQTDAKEQTTIFDYDELKRIKLKDYPSGADIVYGYDDPVIPNSKGRLTIITDASGRASYYYDNMGRKTKIIKEVDGTEYLIEKTYDLLNRIVTYKYPDGEVVTYTYNKSGGIETVVGAIAYVSDIDYNAAERVTYIRYGNGTYTSYTYNENTLRLENIKTNDGNLQDLSYQFDNVGNIREIDDYINTATQTFDYDDLNRVIQAQGSYGTINYVYDSIGNIREKNGITYDYGQDGVKPHAVTWGDDGFLAYYDENGNMISKNDDIYEYDYENRLIKTISINGAAEEISISINLQPGWNFISMPLIPDNWSIGQVLSSITLGADYIQVSRYNQQTDSFENYVGNPKFNQFDMLEYGRGYQIYVINPSGCTLTLTGRKPDARRSYSLSAGWNLVSSPIYEETPVEDALSFLEFEIDYDMVARYNSTSGSYETYPGSLTTFKPGEAYYIYCLKAVDYSPPLETIETTYVYNAKGSRVKKITTDGTTLYIGKTYEIRDSVGKKYIYIGGNRITSRDENGNTYFYHSDHINGSNIITDSSGQAVQLIEYTPFGKTSLNDGSIDVAHKFTGKELDLDTGLYYYGARYYNPHLGRFVTPDSIIQDPYDPQTLNRYAYCRNNPVKYVDPSGNIYQPVRWALNSIFNFVRGIFSGGRFSGGFSPGRFAASWAWSSGEGIGKFAGIEIGMGIYNYKNQPLTLLRPTGIEKPITSLYVLGIGTRKPYAQRYANDSLAYVGFSESRSFLSDFTRAGMQLIFGHSKASQQLADFMKTGNITFVNAHSEGCLSTWGMENRLAENSIKMNNLHINFIAPPISKGSIARSSQSMGASYRYYLNDTDPIGALTTPNPYKIGSYLGGGLATLARGHFLENYTFEENE